MRAISTRVGAENAAISWCCWQPEREYGRHNGMTDTVNSEVRSKIMSRVRSKDSKAEVTLRKALHARGFRYRVNRRGLPGTPDLVFPRRGAVLFVHGCFGIDTTGADGQRHQQPTRPSGPRSSSGTSSATLARSQNWRPWVGASASCGNARSYDNPSDPCWTASRHS